MSFDPTPRSLDALAWRIAEHGFAGHGVDGTVLGDDQDEVRSFARAALAAGVSADVVAVLVDPSASEVARQRAFGLAAAAFAERTAVGGPPTFVVAA